MQLQPNRLENPVWDHKTYTRAQEYELPILAVLRDGDRKMKIREIAIAANVPEQTAENTLRQLSSRHLVYRTSIRAKNRRPAQAFIISLWGRERLQQETGYAHRQEGEAC